MAITRLLANSGYRTDSQINPQLNRPLPTPPRVLRTRFKRGLGDLSAGTVSARLLLFGGVDDPCSNCTQGRQVGIESPAAFGG